MSRGEILLQIEYAQNALNLYNGLLMKLEAQEINAKKQKEVKNDRQK